MVAKQLVRQRSKVNHIRFLMVIIGFVLVTIPLLLLILNAKLLRLKFADKIPQYFHKIILKILGVHVEISGDLKKDSPLIIVSNHISWLDIPVIGSQFPCYFIAKSEISCWPVLGYLAKLQNTIFVNRKAKGAEISAQVQEISDTLKAHKPIILFPEGTTSDGNRILPFKSALLAAAKGDETYQPYVQTLNINYNKIAGMPTRRDQKPFIAWYGDMDILSHLKSIFRVTPITARLSLGQVMTYDNFVSRQTMAKHLETEIRINNS